MNGINEFDSDIDNWRIWAYYMFIGTVTWASVFYKEYQDTELVIAVTQSI